MKILFISFATLAAISLLPILAYPTIRAFTLVAYTANHYYRRLADSLRLSRGIRNKLLLQSEVDREWSLTTENIMTVNNFQEIRVSYSYKLASLVRDTNPIRIANDPLESISHLPLIESFILSKIFIPPYIVMRSYEFFNIARNIDYRLNYITNVFHRSSVSRCIVQMKLNKDSKSNDPHFYDFLYRADIIFINADKAVITILDNELIFDLLYVKAAASHCFYGSSITACEFISNCLQPGGPSAAIRNVFEYICITKRIAFVNLVAHALLSCVTNKKISYKLETSDMLQLERNIDELISLTLSEIWLEQQPSLSSINALGVQPSVTSTSLEEWEILPDTLGITDIESATQLADLQRRIL